MIKAVIILTLVLSTQLLLATDIYIVLNKSITEKQFNKKHIQSLFLKKKLYWDDGSKVRPVEQVLGNKAREEFLNQVLFKSEIEMSEYWIEQKQVNGLVQPIQLDNNEMVIQLVSSLTGSIGYILMESDLEIDTNKLKTFKVSK